MRASKMAHQVNIAMKPNALSSNPKNHIVEMHTDPCKSPSDLCTCEHTHTQKFYLFIYFETGFLCIALAILKLTL